jgi:hypothetical protein
MADQSSSVNLEFCRCACFTAQNRRYSPRGTYALVATEDVMTAPGRSEVGRSLRISCVRILSALFVLAGLAAAPVHAETYKYVDDKGTVVFTDDPKTVPERYRPRVMIVERTGTPTTSVEQILSKADEVGKGFVVGGLTPYQSRVLVLGFAAGVLLFAVMMLSGNSAVRLLMRWLLVLLAIGTTVSIYSSNDTVTQKASQRSKELERAQQQKAKAIEQMEAGGEASR